jgi:hypothetical protein
MWATAIWIVYGLCAAVFILWCILPLRELKRLLRERNR